MVKAVALTAVPYLIQPSCEDDALHGKPVLLTDCELALIMSAISKNVADTGCEDETLGKVYNKIFTAWNQTVPN